VWSDDKCVIQRAFLTEIAEFGCRCNQSGSRDSPTGNELNLRMLGGHIAIFQLVTKHVGCLGIQWEGMCALANFCHPTKPTKKPLGDVSFVEVILANMNKCPNSDDVQWLGCVTTARLVHRMKGDAERVEKSGGIAVAVAAMKAAHPSIENLQNNGCCALSRMSKWDECRPLIVKAGGASAIASVMEKDWWEDTQLRERACNVMERSSSAKKPCWPCCLSCSPDGGFLF
jgi:hypothetical protein